MAKTALWIRARGVMILALVALMLPCSATARRGEPQRRPDPPEVIALRAREKSEIDQLERLARGYLWPANDAEFREASARLSDPAFAGVSRRRFMDFEEILRRGRPAYGDVAAKPDGTFAV